MSTLQILCPNGRRQNVKINPNTKLLQPFHNIIRMSNRLDPDETQTSRSKLFGQVLEEVCQKQKFLPAEDYKLIHGRTTLDLTLSVRYANLANNAKLELVKSEKSRAESEVLIALQLESGQRLQHAFLPVTSLWDILLHWENIPDSPHNGILTKVDSSQTPATHPVCIYMREEVVGEAALRETKLRTLGLTGGKAVLRLAHRPIDDKTLSEISNKIEKAKQQKAKLEKSISQTSQDLPQSTSEASVQTPPAVYADTGLPGAEAQSTVVKSESTSISLNINVNIQNDNKAPAKEQPVSTDDKVEEPKPKVGKMEKADSDAEPMEVEPSESAESAMDTEDIPKSKPEPDSTSSVEDTAAARRQAQREAAEQLRAMNIPGVEIFTPDDFAELTPEQQQVAQKLAEAIMPRLGLVGQGQGQQGAAKRGTKPKQKQPKAQSFAEFKFPEETKGKKLYDNDMSDVKKQDYKPCDRQTIIYSLEENILPGDSATDTELPDDFFEVKEADLRKLMMDHQKQLDSVDNQPLMTSSMRQARLEAAYGKYDRVVIRVQFHDKMVLQGLFRPRETVFAVQKFVKEYLEDKSTSFHLYTSPPKCVLKDHSQTLLQARLVPASVVYFGSEQQQDHYLSEAVLSEVRPRLQAEQIIAECLGTSQYEEPPPVPKAGSSKGKQPVSKRAPGPSTSSEPSTSGQSDSKPVPKWFKIGKK